MKERVGLCRRQEKFWRREIKANVKKLARYEAVLNAKTMFMAESGEDAEHAHSSPRSLSSDPVRSSISTRRTRDELEAARGKKRRLRVNARSEEHEVVLEEETHDDHEVEEGETSVPAEQHEEEERGAEEEEIVYDPLQPVCPPQSSKSCSTPETSEAHAPPSTVLPATSNPCSPLPKATPPAPLASFKAGPSQQRAKKGAGATYQRQRFPGRLIQSPYEQLSKTKKPKLTAYEKRVYAFATAKKLSDDNELQIMFQDGNSVMRRLVCMTCLPGKELTDNVVDSYCHMLNRRFSINDNGMVKRFCFPTIATSRMT